MTLVSAARLLVLLGAACLSGAVDAREEVQDFPIQQALASATAQAKLDSGVQFYFGRQPYAEPDADYGSYKTQKREDASQQTVGAACNAAFVAALAALEDRALLEGGNAVVDIASTYDDNLILSRSDFKCGATDVMVGVALQGRVVTLPGIEAAKEAQTESPEREVRAF